MALYRISGVWKNMSNVITHYAFHKVNDDSTGRAVKKSKAEAIVLLESGNFATTWIWNYNRAIWNAGQAVQVVNGATGKYLRSDPDNKLTDNLGHLIDFDWISP